MDEPKKDKDNNLIMKLGIDDSALVVRVDGTVELISSELTDKEDGYIGDRIKVRNQESGEIVYATVIDVGLVEIVQ